MGEFRKVQGRFLTSPESTLNLSRYVFGSIALVSESQTVSDMILRAVSLDRYMTNAPLFGKMLSCRGTVVMGAEPETKMDR